MRIRPCAPVVVATAVLAAGLLTAAPARADAAVPAVGECFQTIGPVESGPLPANLALVDCRAPHAVEVTGVATIDPSNPPASDQRSTAACPQSAGYRAAGYTVNPASVYARFPMPLLQTVTWLNGTSAFCATGVTQYRTPNLETWRTVSAPLVDYRARTRANANAVGTCLSNWRNTTSVSCDATKWAKNNFVLWKVTDASATFAKYPGVKIMTTWSEKECGKIDKAVTANFYPLAAAWDAGDTLVNCFARYAG